MKTIFLALLLIFVSCTLNTDRKQNNQDAGRMTYIFDMVFNNPGEAPTITKYKNPAFLKETGYNGMVPHWNIQCRLTYDSFEKNIIPKESEESVWILKKQKWVKEKLHEAVKIWEQIEKLSNKIEMNNPEDINYLAVSATYGRIKYEIIEKAFTVVLLGYLGDKTGNYDKKRINDAIKLCDRLWFEWKQLKSEHPSSASIYKPYAFQINTKGVSGNIERGLITRINQYREL